MNNKIKYKHQMLLLQALLRKYERTYNKHRKAAILKQMHDTKAMLKDLRKVLAQEKINESKQKTN